MIFKQAFRVAFVALIWKQYKAAIISTVLLFIYLYIVSRIHQDYLTAVGPDGIEKLTFVYKWAAFITGFAVYFGFHIIRGRIKAGKQTDKEKILETRCLI